MLIKEFSKKSGGLRRLDFSLGDIIEILAMRDSREDPCRVVLDLLSSKANEIAQRIAASLSQETVVLSADNR